MFGETSLVSRFIITKLNATQSSTGDIQFIYKIHLTNIRGAFKKFVD